MSLAEKFRFDRRFAIPLPVAQEPEVPDCCDRAGAQRLADTIRAYWLVRGYDVQISLVEGGFHKAMRSNRVDVRSEMVNGLPVRRATA